MGKLTLLLLAILVWLQYSLWFGKNGIHDYTRVNDDVAAQQATNAKLKARNDQLFAEIDDLNGGQEALEERADFKKDDTLQTFGSDHVDLGAQTLEGVKTVGIVRLREGGVRILQTEVPHALGLDFRGVRGGKGRADQPGGEQQRSQSLHGENLLSS